MSPKQHFDAADGLRAVAVSLVILFHGFYLNLYRVTGPARDELLRAVPDTLQWIWHGEKGVDVFFVLSGFLLTYLLLQERERTGRVCLRGFYLKRVFRIVPAYLVLLAYGLVAGWPNGEAVWRNLLFVNNLGPPEASFLTWTWSIAVEVHFYLVLPLVFLALKGRPARLAVVGCAALAAVAATRHGLLAQDPALYQAPFFELLDRTDLRQRWLDALYLDSWVRAAPLLVGVLVAVIHFSVSGRARAGRVALAWGGLVLAGAMASVPYLDPGSWYGRGFDAEANLWYLAHGRTLFAIGVGMVLYTVVSPGGGAGVLARALGSRWLRPVARASYSMYLFHIPILVVLSDLILGPGGAARGVVPHWAGLVAVGVAAWVATLALATASYRWIERPGIRWSHAAAARICKS